MRALRWSLVVVLGVVALAAAAAWLFLGPYLESDAFEQRLEHSARETLGLEVAYDRLALQWLPLEVAVTDLRVDYAGDRPDPLLRARSARLRVALLPLLVGQVVLDSLATDGAVLTLIREADGLRVPVAPDTDSAGDSAEWGRDGVHLLPWRISVHDSQVVVIDRTVVPPDSVELSQVQIEARPQLTKANLSFEASARLPEGGRLAAEGTVDARRRVEVSFSVDEALRALPWVPARLAQVGVEEARGRVRGSADVSASGGRLDRVAGQVTLGEGALRYGEVDLAGALDVRFELEPAGEGTLELDLTLERGGRIAGRGGLTSEGPLDVEVTFQDVALAQFMAWVPDAQELGGVAHGRATVAGPLLVPGRVHAQVEVPSASFVSSSVVVRGPVKLDVELDAAAWRAPEAAAQTARFRADLTAARLRYERLTKPAGVRGEISGTVRRDSEGALVIEAESVRLGNLDLRVELRRAPDVDGTGTRISVRSEPFDVVSLVALVPELDPWLGEGRVVLPELVVDVAPLRLVGEAALEDVELDVWRSRGALSGTLVLAGDQVTGEHLRLVIGGQPLVGSARLEGIGGDLVLHSKVANEGPLRSEPFFSALLGHPSAVKGPLAIEADIVHRLGVPLAQGLEADLRLVIGGEHGTGRIPQLSWFDSLTRSNELVAAFTGGAGKLTSVLRPEGHPLAKYYGDEFEVLEAKVQVADGIADYPSLRIVYPFYTVSLSGTVTLDDGSLDMAGSITLFDGDSQGRGAELRRGVDIPIASVRGTLDAPRVAVGPGGVDLFFGFVLARTAGTKAWQLVDRLLRGDSGAD